MYPENITWIGNLTYKCHLEFHNYRKHQAFSEVIPLVNNQRLIVVYRKGQSPLLLIQIYPEDLFVTLIASFWYVLSYTSLTMPGLTWRVHCKSLWNCYCFRINVFFFVFFLSFHVNHWLITATKCLSNRCVRYRREGLYTAFFSRCRRCVLNNGIKPNGTRRFIQNL